MELAERGQGPAPQCPAHAHPHRRKQQLPGVGVPFVGRNNLVLREAGGHTDKRLSCHASTRLLMGSCLLGSRELGQQSPEVGERLEACHPSIFEVGTVLGPAGGATATQKTLARKQEDQEQ